MPFALGPTELAIILAIVIFVFGAGKVAASAARSARALANSAVR
jgi:Sec-independent protein translocase protein TatA